ncbi:hypothetical protein J132_09702 [Termitomyces sp. J132]|nr:hypothetical protein H2248_009181 [Termitomyces sp. 'cryptogamus']KNZ73800.1 hypothetical protein J132_09702 [Termitomyces sp. J132]
MIVVLNGFPGTGKYTILKHAKALLPAEKIRLLDNHLLIDPATALIPERSDAHYNLRCQIRAPVFKEIRQIVQKGYIILMTACLAEGNDRDAAFLQEHLDIVRGTSVPLFWISAHCDLAVLEQRVSSPERCQGVKTKLTDVGVLHKLVSENHLIEPPHDKNEDGSIRLVVETLDTSGSVEDSVARLMDLIGIVHNMTVR